MASLPAGTDVVTIQTGFPIPSATGPPISLAIEVPATSVSTSAVPSVAAPVLSATGFAPISVAPVPLPTAVIAPPATTAETDALFTFSHPAESSSGSVFLPCIPEDDSWTSMTDASRAAYRAEIQQFMVPIEGEQPPQTRLRERIAENWKVLSVVEDMYLACKGKPLFSEEGLRMDYASSFLWLHGFSVVKRYIQINSGFSYGVFSVCLF